MSKAKAKKKKTGKKTLNKQTFSNIHIAKKSKENTKTKFTTKKKRNEPKKKNRKKFEKLAEIKFTAITVRLKFFFLQN